MVDQAQTASPLGGRTPSPGSEGGHSSDAFHPSPPARFWRRHRLRLALLAVVALGVGIVGVRYYLYAVAHESTDDAFIEGHIIPISAKVAGYIRKVYIDDNWHVKTSDTLVELDSRDFEARLAQAQGNLAATVAAHQAAKINVQVVDTTSGGNLDEAQAAVQAAMRQVDGDRSRLEEARAQVVAEQAEAVRAHADAQRYEELLGEGAVSQQLRDNAVATDRTAAANLDAARKAEGAAAEALRQAQAQQREADARLASAKAAPNQVAYSRAQADTAAAQITQLQAIVRQAELDLSYTRIVAPESGRITRKSVEPGAYVQVGQTLFSIVPDQVWVVANFKETQLSQMRPGQPVQIRVDAYPDRVFRGHVDSIQRGTGAQFSLLPPENATGNYVKVVQRVPVKIVFDEPPDPDRPLGPGMSVVPVVKVR